MKKKMVLSSDECMAAFQESRIETMGVLRCEMGLCKRIATSDKWDIKTRALAMSLMPEILNEIHDLKIEIENERLKEVPF